MRAINLHKQPLKRALQDTGESVTLVHVSGEATWGGDYDQTPVYSSGTSTVYARIVPIRDEVQLEDQIYTLGDVRAFLPYNTSVEPNDQITATGTFSGTWTIMNVVDWDAEKECYCKKNMGTSESI
jgi:hypothetical protein